MRKVIVSRGEKVVVKRMSDGTIKMTLGSFSIQDKLSEYELASIENEDESLYIYEWHRLMEELESRMLIVLEEIQIGRDERL